MELPTRAATDRFIPSGEYRRLANRLRQQGTGNDVATLIVSAFDNRTRMLPFIVWDRQIVPAGARAVSAALAGAGFTRQRLVNQAWTPNVRASSALIDGRRPELLMVSAMQIHSDPAFALIRDAHAMGSDRPLIVAGGPKAIYQPWEYFGFDEQDHSADIVCTGEEYVLLELLDRLGESKRQNESYRRAFERARDHGWLDDIPGLVYARGDGPASERELVDTGVQRLLCDLDELPSPVEGYRYLEPAHKGRSLRQGPLPLREIHNYSKVAAILTTRGCKFRCSFCPIPAYNQRSLRNRSPGCLVRDLADLRRELGIHLFFGTDDNFFNDEQLVVETFETIADAGFEKDDIGKPVRFGTEGTVFDVHKQRHLLPLCYRGGLRAVWMGVEDMSAVLIKKGQSVSKTIELFDALRRNRILPMAMMIHFDGQPLISRGSAQGLLNQVRLLYRAGAASVQVTVLGPAAGTKDYDEVMRRGIILKRLGRTPVTDRRWDGNHVISVASSKPWKLQRNVLLAYGLFYNPLNLLRSLVKKNGKWSDVFLQVWGMWGLLLTAWRLMPWMLKLFQVAGGRFEVHRDIIASRWPIDAPSSTEQAGDSVGNYVQQTVGASAAPAEAGAERRAALSKY